MMRPFTAALVALAALTTGCTSGRARVFSASPVTGLDVSIDEAFYVVAGRTPWELNRDLRRGALRHEGERWQGLTRFRVSYSYRAEQDDAACRPGRPRVAVELVTTLPRWDDRAVAPEALRTDWDLFLSRLRAHEAGHHRIAIGVGHALLDEVAALEAPDCAALRRRAAALARSYRASVTEEQKAWDDETAHGLRAPEPTGL